MDGQDGTAWEETGLSGNEKIEDTVQCISLNSRPGHTTIEVKSIPCYLLATCERLTNCLHPKHCPVSVFVLFQH